MDDSFLYLIGSSLFFVYWIVLFFIFSDYRKIILAFSFGFGCIGFLSSCFWFTVDWWQPETITGTCFGVEDFILGFTNAGIACVGYLFLWREKEGSKQNFPLIMKSRIVIPLLITPIITMGLMVFDVSSFYANCIGILAAIVYILFQRRDLIGISVFSGFFLLILSLPIYFFLIYLSPTWVESTWMLDKLSGILLLGVPIEDYIWYFLSGAIIGIMYPYFSGKRYKVRY